VPRFKLWQRCMVGVLGDGLRKVEATASAPETRGYGAYPG
jgi:hypothetical protein